MESALGKVLSLAEETGLRFSRFALIGAAGLCIVGLMGMALLQFTVLHGTSPAAFHGRLLEQHLTETGSTPALHVLWVSGDNGAGLAVVENGDPATTRLWIARSSANGEPMIHALAFWYSLVLLITPAGAMAVGMLLLGVTCYWLIRSLRGNGRIVAPAGMILFVLGFALLSIMATTSLHGPEGTPRWQIAVAWFLSTQGFVMMLVCATQYTILSNE